jgi:hypothetical protein
MLLGPLLIEAAPPELGLLAIEHIGVDALLLPMLG